MARKTKKAGPCRTSSVAPVATPARERATKAAVTLRAALTWRFFGLPAAWVSGFIRLGLTPGFVAAAPADRLAGLVADLASGLVAGGAASLVAADVVAAGAGGSVAGGVLGLADGSAVGLVAGAAGLNRPLA